MCKHRSGVYDTRRPAWVKVKNPNYTQAEGRVELFEDSPVAVSKQIGYGISDPRLSVQRTRCD